jgi:hypothetical protein
MYIVRNLFNSYEGIAALVALAAAVLGLAGVVLLLIRQQRLLRQYSRLMTGTTGGNLEVLLNQHMANVQSTAHRLASVEKLTDRLEEAGFFAFQHLGMIRYNAFHDTGSDQSFAIALADGGGNGVVLSSLHARDVTRVYAKPLEKWESTYQLTQEERRAIAGAHQRQL